MKVKIPKYISICLIILQIEVINYGMKKKEEEKYEKNPKIAEMTELEKEK